MWTPFWFEGNQWFEMVNGPADWERLLSVHAKVGVGIDRVMCHKFLFGGIAQLVERVLCKHDVIGSIPVASRQAKSGHLYDGAC